MAKDCFMDMNQIILLLAVVSCVATLTISPDNSISGTPLVKNSSDINRPSIFSPHLDLELVSSGITYPTDMEFLDNDDILVLEKNNGTVRRIIDGQLLDKPILDVGVANEEERGMLGITVSKENTVSNNNDGKEKTYVFLYYTEAEEDGGAPVGNHLYRYELIGDRFVDLTLLLGLPAEPGPYHNGGKIEIGPDGYLYIIVGDVDNAEDSKPHKRTQNSGLEPDGRSGILRIGQDGEDPEPLLGEEPNSLSRYYAYGIRNGYGIDFDPVTEELWDTENGPNPKYYGDEINLVKPGFNSGWDILQGFRTLMPNKTFEGLENYGGIGKYSDPEFVWNIPSGPTSLKFLGSSKYGEEFINDLIVGDYHNGYLYHFKLSRDRTSLALNGQILDKTATGIEELKDVILGKGFQGITDIEVGPDGYLYVVSYWGGSIWRIVPAGG